MCWGGGWRWRWADQQRKSISESRCLIVRDVFLYDSSLEDGSTRLSKKVIKFNAEFISLEKVGKSQIQNPNY